MKGDATQGELTLRSKDDESAVMGGGRKLRPGGPELNLELYHDRESPGPYTVEHYL